MQRAASLPDTMFLPPTYSLTRHAMWRMSKRGISVKALCAAFYFGRVAVSCGAEVFAIGHKEVRQAKRQGLDLSPYAGIQVICTMSGRVLTAYRSHRMRRRV